MRICILTQNGTTSMFVFDAKKVRDSQVMRWLVTEYMEDHRENEYGVRFKWAEGIEARTAQLLTPESEQFESRLLAVA
jgi:hypothetical protein